MPANVKYLTKSPWQRFAKLSAGLVGGYLVSMAFHVALATWINRPVVIISSTYTAFLLWVGLFIVAFLIRNGWKIWGLYLLSTLIFAALACSGNLMTGD